MTVLAWHFLPRDRRLGHDDGRLVRKGRTLRVKGEPVLCLHGMHGSRRLINALNNAPGPIIERVEIGADEPYKIIENKGKLVGNWRKTLWWMDATTILHEFACREAEDALRDAGVTDERCWSAIRVKRLWIEGKATDNELDEAREAANNDVSEPIAQAAVIAAIPDAAWSAVVVAVQVAPCDTARNTARARQNRRLTAMVCAAHRKN